MLLRCVFKVVITCLCLQSSYGFSILKEMMDYAEEGNIEELENICLANDIKPSKCVWLAAAKKCEIGVLSWGYQNHIIPQHYWHLIYEVLAISLFKNSLFYTFDFDS